MSGFDEVDDPAERGRRLTEGSEVVDRLLRGGTVRHDGPCFTVDGMRLLPGCVQEPRVPMWFATRSTAGAPLRRAAGYEGIAPVELCPEELAEVVGRVEADPRRARRIRRRPVPGHRAPTRRPSSRPARTWVLWQVPPDAATHEVAACIDAGPPVVSRLFVAAWPPADVVEELRGVVVPDDRTCDGSLRSSGT